MSRLQTLKSLNFSQMKDEKLNLNEENIKEEELLPSLNLEFVEVDSPQMKIEKKPKKLTEVKSDIFKEMKTNKGTSIHEIQEKGLKIFLFFFSSIGTEKFGKKNEVLIY